jgi:hypothetical protein
MDHDATRIDDLRAMLAVKRQTLEDYRLERINLTAGELHKLHRQILEEEQVLRDLGITDA